MSALHTAMMTSIGVHAMSEYLKEQGITAPADETKIPSLVIKMAGVKSQANMSALVINLKKGKTTSDELQDLLGLAFPRSKAAGGKRHGSYYMSKARTGQLPGCHFKPAKEAGKKPAAVVVVDTAKTDALEKRVKALEAIIAGAQKARSFKDAQAILRNAPAPAPAAIETASEPEPELALVPTEDEVSEEVVESDSEE